TIVELGIFGGGTTALLNEIARPRKLVAIELNDERVEALDAYREAHGATDTVKPYYGVDQAARARLVEIIDHEFEQRPLDLIIDDASHHVDLTRASFDLLFPRLRPGGAFIIEDWAWAHGPFSAYRPGDVPLTTLVFEMVMACASHPGLVSTVTVDQHWALVERGEDSADADSFTISSCYSERGRELVTTLLPSTP
ncbi:MAG: class I SAM-dependent methyltransferase, partial [Acidimicrobiales bacterium]